MVDIPLAAAVGTLITVLVIVIVVVLILYFVRAFLPPR